jgi:hypothetical protein
MQFSWYVGWGGLVLAVVGGYGFVRREVSARHFLLLAVSGSTVALDLVFFSANRYQFYYGRYFVTALLPLSFIFLAGALVTLWERGNRARLLAGVAAGLLALQYLAPYFYNPAYRQEELAGGYDSLLSLARAIPPGGITFINCPAGDYPIFYRRNATALMCIFGREVLAREDRKDSMRATAPLLRLLLRQGREVNLVWAGLQPLRETVIAGDLWFEPVAAGEYSCQETERVSGIPSRLSPSRLPWQVFRAHLDPSGCRPIEIVFPSKIADSFGMLPPRNTTQLVNLPSRRRADGGIKSSWTGGVASFNGIPIAKTGSPLQLTLQLAGEFPVEIDPKIRIAVNGEVLLDERLSGRVLRARRSIGPLVIPARLNRGELNINLRITPLRAGDGESGPVISPGPQLGLDLTGLLIQPQASGKAPSSP